MSAKAATTSPPHGVAEWESGQLVECAGWQVALVRFAGGREAMAFETGEWAGSWTCTGLDRSSQYTDQREGGCSVERMPEVGSDRKLSRSLMYCQVAKPRRTWYPDE